MDLTEKIITTIIAGLIVSIIIYAFRVRQLYLLIPKMFSYSELDDGNILELSIFNRGRSMEEDVHVDMPPALTYTLIAADYPDVKLNENKITLSRVAPLTGVSIILMVEEPMEPGSFSPTINSKTTNGKIVKKIEDIPGNKGSYVIQLAVLFIVLGLSVYTPIKWKEYSNNKRLNEYNETLESYSFVEQVGFRKLENYISSELRNSYSSLEFPLMFESTEQKNKNLAIKFLMTNKTAAPIEVTAVFETEEVNNHFSGLVKNVYGANVNPMQSTPIIVEMEIPNPGAYPMEKVFVRFFLKYATEDISDLVFIQC